MRKTKNPPPTPSARPADQTLIQNCTFITGQAGAPPSGDVCAAVVKLAEAITEAAKALQGTRPGVANDPAIRITPAPE